MNARNDPQDTKNEIRKARDERRNMMTRRDALKRGIAGGASLMLIDPLSRRVQSAPLPAKAKSVIQIWMWGGPSHLDTFDPKPDAGDAYTGPLKNPIPTNVSGIRIGELLPLLAKQADKYAIIRSMTHGNNGHETASYIVQTGHEPGRLVYPCIGAVVSLFKGVEHGYKGLVPPYIVLTQPQGRFSEAGFLGPKYKPFATGGDPARTPFAVEGIVARGITDERQRSRRDLLNNLDSLGQLMPNNPHFEAFDEAGQKAYDLMFGQARKLFDLTEESDELRDKYGRLLAYIYLTDGSCHNAELVHEGYAHAYVQYPFQFLEEFRELEKEAMNKNRGLWK